MTTWEQIWDWFMGLPWYLQIALLVALSLGLVAAVRWIIVLLDPPDKARCKEDSLPVLGYDDNGDPIRWKPDKLAEDLYSCMKGANWGTCATLWQEIIDLPYDAQVCVLFNHFNEYYGEGSNLIEWIQGEHTWQSWTPGADKATRNAAAARIKKATGK